MSISGVILVVVLAIVESVAMKTITGVSERIEGVQKLTEKLRLKSFNSFSQEELSKSIHLYSKETEYGWMRIRVSTALDMIPVMIHTVRRYSTREIDDAYAVFGGAIPIAVLCVPKNLLLTIAYLAIYYIVFAIVSKIVKRPVVAERVLDTLNYQIAVVQNCNEGDNVQIEDYADTFDSWIIIESCMSNLFLTAKQAEAVCVAAIVVASVIAIVI